MERFVRFVREGEPSWGVIVGETIHALARAPYCGVTETGAQTPLAGATLLAPCEPGKIVAVGKNYYDHAREMGGDAPANPILFIKPNTTVNDPEATVVRPRSSQALDYEGELAFVVGRRATRVAAADAADYIFGYTILNDITARDLQSADGQWTRAKSFDGFAPVGPYLVTGIDAGDLSLTTRLNGEVKQASRTSLMMWGVPALLEFITEVMTLLPGDVVTTGTPAGIGRMADGDEVEVEIEGLGVLRNRVRWEQAD
ncbi:MAG: fumarylacetoacetate hydrolase family protein [Propionibacteriaceae bacterium]|jgi:2-keto-4-pentenoate hydratase/2-oxohepta-3-ene-1,7-dioic acid hydratase in catechol pathway|nr:fumarylacetoacetate hydrolase family protein [Propionibacteriaceae bacterium]